MHIKIEMYNSQPIFAMGRHTLFCTLCCYAVGLRLSQPESRGVCLIITCQRAVRLRALRWSLSHWEAGCWERRMTPLSEGVWPARMSVCVCVILSTRVWVCWVCVCASVCVCVVCTHLYFCLSLGVRWMGCGGSFRMWVTRELGEREVEEELSAYVADTCRKVLFPRRLLPNQARG